MSSKINITELPDSKLIVLYQETGDTVYIGHLYTRYTKFILAVCMKYYRDVEKSKDAVMCIFERLISDLLKYEVENVRSWLHVVAKNYCLSELRKKTPENNIDESFPQNFMETEEDMHHNEKLKPETEDAVIHDAIEKLKPQQRDCVKLFYFDEKSYKEIEKETGFSYNEIKSHIQNGKRKLRILLRGMVALVILVKVVTK